MNHNPDLFNPRTAVENCPLDMLQHREEIVPFIEWLITDIFPEDGDTTILEIGTGAGGLTLLWTALADRVISIDNTDPVAYFERMQRMVPYQRQGCNLTILNGSSQSVLMDQMVSAMLDDGGQSKVDLLFIDGDHAESAVRTDFNLYCGLVKPGGVVAFHDINAPQHPGVRRLWQELAEHPGRSAGAREFSVGESDWGGLGAVIMR